MGSSGSVVQAFSHERCRTEPGSHTQKEELHQSCSFKAVIMLRLALVALIAALVHATTPDNVSSRLMIHVSFVQLV